MYVYCTMHQRLNKICCANLKAQKATVGQENKEENTYKYAKMSQKVHVTKKAMRSLLNHASSTYLLM